MAYSYIRDKMQRDLKFTSQNMWRFENASDA